MNIEHFRQLPIMGIVRGADIDVIEPLAEAIILSGLKTIEITMNTFCAPKLIQKMVKTATGRLTVGAGTVMTMIDLHSALDAGASFIVMPILVNDIAEYCAKRKIPVFPGAFTPQEIYNAWSAGATMVKVFPAKFFGLDYIKEIKGPFNDIELLACGGVSPENINSFFSCGASAVAFGASVFTGELLNKREFVRIEERIKALITAYNSWYGISKSEIPTTENRLPANRQA